MREKDETGKTEAEDEEDIVNKRSDRFAGDESFESTTDEMFETFEEMDG